MLIIDSSNNGSAVNNINQPANLVSNSYLPFIYTDILSRYNTEQENFTEIYYKPAIATRVKANSSKNIIYSLAYNSNLIRYVFSNLNYNVGKGIILDDLGKVLMVLTVKKTSLVNFSRESITFDDYNSRFTYDNFILFVSSELASDPKHSVFYRRLLKIYLNFCYEKGMEVRYLPSSVIEKNTFANSLNLRFNSVTELDHHLRNEVQFFSTWNETRAMNQTFHIDLPPISIVEEVVQEVVQEEVDFFDSLLSASSNVRYGTADYVMGGEYIEPIQREILSAIIDIPVVPQAGVPVDPDIIDLGF